MKNIYSLIICITLMSSCAATELGSLVYTGYGSISYSNAANQAYEAIIKETGLKSADLLYTCYVADEFDHKINCSSEDSPKEKNFINLAKKLKKAGYHITLRIYVDLQNQKWRAFWHPKEIKLAFLELEKTLNHYASVAGQVKADTLLIGSEYEKLTQPKYLPYWKKLIKSTREKFSGKIIYAANGNINKGKKPEYTWVPFWDLLDNIGINYYPPFKGKPNKSTLSKHHKRELKKYVKFVTGFKKPLSITEVGFPLAESGLKTPYKWEYPKKERPNSSLRVLSFKTFLKEAHKLNIYNINLWRFLPNEEKYHPNGYVIDKAFLGEISLLNRK